MHANIMASRFEIFLKKAVRGARLKSSRLLGVFPAGIIFLSAGLLQAQLIDVDFNNNSYGTLHGSPGPNPGPTMSGAAVLGAAGDQWNGINTNTASGTGISLIYANGNASPVKMTFTSDGGYDVKNNSSHPTPFASTPYDALMEDYLYTMSGAKTITLSGLATNASYNLVLYNAVDDGAAGRITSFTVNGNTQSSTWNGTSSTLIAGIDYVQFTSAKSDSSGNLAITYTGSGSLEGDVNGLQIQGQPPVVTITSPTNGAVFTSPANVNIAASATYSGGTVSSVQFFANGVSLGSVSTAPFGVPASNLSAGAYTFWAVVTAAGISVTSSVVSVSVSGQVGSANNAAYTWTTFAGTTGTGTADGTGSNARFNHPQGVVSDTNGNAYVTDSGNNTIRKVTRAGVSSTIAGFAGTSGTNDGVGGNARFFNPTGITMDHAGNLYVVDTYNNTIRKMTPFGTNWVVSTIAGHPTQYNSITGLPINGSADGTNSAAQFNWPIGITLDGTGNLYIADTDNSTIRKIAPIGTNWVVTTLAGNAGNFGVVDGTGTNAVFDNPWGIAVDSSTNLYVTDSGGRTVRKVKPVGTNWVVATIAGLANTAGSADGTNSNARFSFPEGIAVNNTGTLYVADTGNYTIRKIMPQGTNWVVTTIAGVVPSRFSIAPAGSSDGTGTNAQFNIPAGIALDPIGNLFVADQDNNEIRYVTSGGQVTTLAGIIFPKNTDINGNANDAVFTSLQGIAVDTQGNVYVTEAANTVRQITSAGVVSTLAGSDVPTGYPLFLFLGGTNDGVGSYAQFSGPGGLTVDKSGNVYVADGAIATIHTIREVTPAAAVTTIASIAGIYNKFETTQGVAEDSASNFFATYSSDDTIVKITPSGVVTTIAGSLGNAGSTDATGTNAQFNSPSDIAVDTASNIYVADSGNSTIRKITPSGTNWVVSTIAGFAGTPGTNDGVGSAARFGSPCGIAVDSAGNLYVVDNYYDTIRMIAKIGTTWVVTTIGGLAGTPGNIDGSGIAALFSSPNYIAADSVGNLYLADSGNGTIRKGSFTAYNPANPLPYSLPAMNGQLAITMQPPAANGQWRFPWEVAWRTNGQAAGNLVAGNYPVVFRSLPGWLAVPSSLTVGVTNGGTTFVTNQYYPTISTVDANSGGTLTVTLGPSPPAGAGWRFLGDTTPFYPSGYSTNLAAGTYLIQFAAVGGRVTPPNLSVQVQAGRTTFLSENYLLAQSAPAQAQLPTPVPPASISDVADYPFGFNGQLQSDVGYGSGVAVQANVVLTAAHLVFNDQTLGYVSQAYWYFQQETGVFAPEPLAARGWYVLSGYAAQRTNDLQVYSPDTSTPQSRNMDVAALYFLSPVAGGGSGGYLPSDASPNPWLAGNSLKMLVGYPVDGSEFGDNTIVPGEMYQTQPQPYSLNLATDPVADQQVYTASWFFGYPGDSGGAMYAQFNGYYYPAGVYLGTLFNGVTPYASAVRAIDSAVVNLITNAAALGDTGTNYSGGGVITIIPSQAVSASNPGYLEFQLGPPAAVAAGAGWQLQGDTSFSSATNYIHPVLSTNAFTVVFKPIPGWNVPTSQNVTVQPGQIALYNALYTVAAPVQIVSPQVSGGVFQLSFQSVSGQSYTLYYNNDLTTSNWQPYTNVTGNGGTMQFTVPINNSAQSFFRISQP
jgi:Big-like domain-containing protein/NHL repeat-containing protein